MLIPSRRLRTRLLLGSCLSAASALLAAAPAKAETSEGANWGPHAEIVSRPGTFDTSGTAEFFVPLLQDNDTLVFTDMRLGLGTQSDYFGNWGLGVRQIARPNLIIGGFAFFDVTRTDDNENFYGGTAGFELLSTDFDLRASVHIPFTQERFLRTDITNASTPAIVNNRIVESFTTQTFDQIGMYGIDVEAGLRVYADADEDNEFRIYGAIYHFWSDRVGDITGGRARGEYRMHNPFGIAGGQLNLGAEVSDDEDRGTEFTGDIRLRIPFGSGARIAERRARLSPIERRATERIRRDSQMRIRDRTTNATINQLAINDATGQAFGNVFFADGANTLGSGNPDDPTTLIDAVTRAGANGIIVGEGNNGDILTGGVTFANGQQLLGGGTGVQVRLSSGTVQNFVLGQAPGTIANTDPTANTITLANGNVIRNLMFTGGANAIVGTGISGVTIDNVTIGGVAQTGMRFTDAGMVSVSNSTIGGGAAGGFFAATGANDMVVALTNNSFSATGGTVVTFDGAAGPGNLFVSSLADTTIDGGNGETGGLSAQNVIFDADPMTAGIQTVAAGALVIGTASSRVGGTGLSLAGSSGSLGFSSVSIFVDGSTAPTVTTASAPAASAPAGTVTSQDLTAIDAPMPAFMGPDGLTANGNGIAGPQTGIALATPAEGAAENADDAEAEGAASGRATMIAEEAPMTAASPMGSNTDGSSEASEEDGSADREGMIAEETPMAVSIAIGQAGDRPESNSGDGAGSNREGMIAEEAPMAESIAITQPVTLDLGTGGEDGVSDRAGMIVENTPMTSAADLIVENAPMAAGASISASDLTVDNAPMPAEVSIVTTGGDTDTGAGSMVFSQVPVGATNQAPPAGETGAIGPAAAVQSQLVSAAIAPATGTGIAITDNAAELVFAGPTVVDATGADGVRILDSAGGSVTFSGGLSITNSGGTGFNVANSGMVTVSGATNQIVTSQGAALQVLTSTADLTFGSVTSAGGMAGINLEMMAGTVAIGAADIDDSVGDGITVVGSTGTITIDSLDIANAGQDGINISGGTGTLTFGGVSIAGAGDDSISVTDAAGGATFGDVSIATPGGNGVTISGANGDIAFGNVDITGLGATTGVDVSGAGGNITFATLDITGTGAVGSIGIDLSGSTNAGNIVTTESGDIAGVDIGVDLTGANITGNFQYGDGSNTDADGAASTIQANTPLVFTGLGATGDYNFLDVNVIGDTANLQSTAVDLFFIDTTAGAGTANDPGSITQAEASGADVLVLVNDGTSGGLGTIDSAGSTGDDTFLLMTGQQLVSFLNQSSFEVANGGPPANLRVNGFASGGTITIDDPTGNGAAELISSAGDALTLGGNNVIDNVLIGDSAGDGVAIDGLSDPSIITNSMISSVGVSGGSGDVGISDSTLGGIAIDGGSADVTLTNTTINQPLANPAVSVSGGHTGTFTTDETIAATIGSGLQFDNADGSYIFGNDIVIAGGGNIAVFNGSDGTFTFNGATSITGSTGAGITITDSPATFTFGTVAIADATGDAISLNGANGAVSFATIDLDNPGARHIEIIGAIDDVTIGGGTIDDGAATGGFGITIQNQAASSTISFTNVDFMRMAGTPDPLNIQNSDGTINYLGGSITSGSGNDIVDIDGGSATIVVSAALTESGTGNGIEIDGITGGSITFSGNYTRTGTGNAIQIGSNAALTGGTIAFDGPVSAQSGSNVVIGNLGAAIVTFTDTVTVADPAAIAIDITGTNGDITFADVVITGLGASTGIDLTGAEGNIAFASIDITGTGAAGSTGIDLSGSTNSGNVMTTDPSSITGVDTGVDISGANITGMFQFGDGSDVDANGRASTIAATTPIDATGAGATGTFNFLDVDFGGANPGGATGVFGVPTVYYFAETAQGAGDGSSAANAGTVLGAEQATADVIIPVGAVVATIDVFDATVDAQNPTTALDLDTGQDLIGFAMGEDLIDLGFTGPANVLLSATIAQATNVHSDGSPNLTQSDSGAVINLADGNLIADIGIDNSGGNALFGIFGDGVNGLVARDIAIDGAATGLFVTSSTGQFTIDGLTTSNVGRGVDLTFNATAQFDFAGLDIAGSGPTPFQSVGFIATNNGTVSVTGAGNVIDFASGAGLVVLDTAIDMTFDSITGTNDSSVFAADVTGSLTVTGAATSNDSPVDALVIQNSSADFSFGSIAITNGGDDGILIDSLTGSLTVTGATTIDTTVEDAIAVNNSAGMLAFASLDIDNAGDDAVQINNLSGSFAVTGLTDIDNATEDGIDILNGTAAADIDFAAIDINTAGRDGIRITNFLGNVTGNGAVAITAPTANGIFVDTSAGTVQFDSTVAIDASTTSATGILLTDNTGGTINFAGGGLDIDTNSGTGLRASGGGTLSITGTGNTIDVNSLAPIVSLSDMTIAAGGVTFDALTANGALSTGAAISLDNISGGTFAGGAVTIPSVAGGRGIDILNSASNVTFDSISVDSTSGGIRLLNNSGNFSVTGTTSVTNSSFGIDIDSVSGTVDFAGAATLNTGSGAALTLTDNVGGVVSFTGGLDIDTTTATALTATGGGTLNITGGANTIDVTNGQAIILNGMTLDTTFASVNSALTTGALDNISIDNSDGSFTLNAATLSSVMNSSYANIDITQNDGAATRSLTVVLSNLNIDQAVASPFNLGAEEFGVRVQTMGDDAAIVSISDSTFQTEDSAVRLLGFNSLITVTDFSNNTLLGDTTADTPRFFNNGVTFEGVTFDSDLTAVGLQEVQGGIFSAGTVADPLSGGIFFSVGNTGASSQGSIVFDDYQVNAFGTGLTVDGDQAGLTVRILDGDITGAGVSLAPTTSATVDITLASLTLISNDDSLGRGLVANNLAGSFTVTGATSITAPEQAQVIGAFLSRTETDGISISNSSANFLFNSIDMPTTLVPSTFGGTIVNVITTGGPTVGIDLSNNTGTFTVSGATTITDTVEDGIRITDTSGAISFGQVTITNPHADIIPAGTQLPAREAQSAGIDIEGTIGASITFADLDIALQSDASTGVETAGAVLNAAVTVIDFDLTSTSTTGTFGVDLRGTTGTGTMQLGDTDTGGADATIAGVDTGVIFDDAANLDFIFGDGEATADVGSSIAATTAIDFTDDTGTTGTYNFLDVTFPTAGSTTNLELGIDIFYADAGLDGTDNGTAANPGQLNDAAATTADVIVLVDQNNAGTDIIDLNSADQGSIGTFTLSDGQLLLSFGSSDTIDLTTFGFAAGGAPANILLTGISAGSTTINNPNTGFGAPTLNATGTPLTLAAGSTTQISGVSITGGGSGITGDAFAGVTISNSTITGAVNGLDFQFAGNAAASAATVTISNADLTGGTGSGAVVSSDNGDSITVDLDMSTFDTTSSHGLNLIATGTGDIVASLTDITASSTTLAGIRVGNFGTGTVTVTDFSGLTVTQAGANGIQVDDVIFDADTGTAGIQQVAGGDTAIGSLGTRVTGDGLRLNNVLGSLGFGDLDIFNDNGTGLFVRDAGGKAGSFAFASTSGTVDTTNGAALDIDPVAMNTVFDSVTASGGTNGILLDTISGSVTINGGAISGTTGNAVDINASTLNFSYAGTITNTAGRAVEVTNQTAGTITFSGAIDEDGTGINLATNTGATINFTGGLDIDSTTNTGFSATGGGTINLTGTNTIDTTTGQILNLDSVAVGGSGMTFATLTSTGALASGNAINVNAVTGGTFTGGVVTIAGTTAGDGLNITGSSATASFTSFDIDNVSGNGVELNGNSGSFTVSGLTDINAAGSSAVSIQNNSGAYTFGNVTVNNRGGAGIAINAFTGGQQTGQFGTVTINNQNASNTTALAIDNAVTAGGTITVASVAIDNNGSNSSAIALSNNDGATINIQGGSVSNAAGAAVSISSSTGNATYAGTINNSSGRAVQILNNGGGGTVNLTGAITDTGTGVFVDNNDQGGNATVTLSGGMTLTTGGNTAFTATNGGIVNVTGTNIVTTTTGTGVNIASTTIGASGVTFQSVSANGAANGIVLNSTGTTGFFSVTGTGSTLGSGGTIQNTTGSGVLLTNARNVSLTNLDITNTGLHGIEGTTITNLDLARVRITSPGNAANENGITLTNLLGTAAAGLDSRFDTITITGAADNGIQVDNTAATSAGNSSNPDLLTVVNSTIQNSAVGGIQFISGGASGNMRLDVTGSTFTNNASVGIAANANGGIVQANITGGNSLTPGAGTQFRGISGGATSFGQLFFNIDGNTITQNGSAGTGPSAIAFAAFDTATMNGTIANNTISSTTPESGAGGTAVSGISVTNEGSGTNAVAITGNTITINDGFGVIGNAQGSGTGSFGVTVANNTVNVNGSGFTNTALSFTNSGTVGQTLCIAVTGNTLTTSPGANVDIVIDRAALGTFQVQGLGAPDNTAPDFNPDNQAVETFLTNAQANSGAVDTQINPFSSSGFSTGTCTVPVSP